MQHRIEVVVQDKQLQTAFSAPSKRLCVFFHLRFPFRQNGRNKACASYVFLPPAQRRKRRRDSEDSWLRASLLFFVGIYSWYLQAYGLLHACGAENRGCFVYQH